MKQTKGTHQGDNLGVEKIFCLFFKGGGKTYFGQWKKEAAVGIFLTHTEQVNIVLKICLCIRLVE